MNIGILITGNEILTGNTRDTNGVLMARSLDQAGLCGCRWQVCGDDAEQMRNALQNFVDCGVDTVLITGGLGPTSDDITAEVVASFLQKEIVFIPEAWEHCQKIFHGFGRVAPETNRKQAMLPAGSSLLPNPNGTAVGFSIKASVGTENSTLQIYAMPGVPSECEPMFLAHVLPQISVYSKQVHKAIWQVFFLGESVLQQKLNPIEEKLRNFDPLIRISYRAQFRYVTYSLSSEKQFSPGLLQAIEGELGNYTLYRDSRVLEQFIIDECAKNSWSISTAESCTAGEVMNRLAKIPGASAVLAGGFVVYTEKSKQELLGVPEDLLRKHGVVSAEVALAMAKATRQKLQTNFGVAVTGIAGPGGGDAANPVGTMECAMWLPQQFSKTALVVERLENVGWKQVDLGFFSCRANMGKHYQRVALQHRTAEFLLGSVATVLASVQSS